MTRATYTCAAALGGLAILVACGSRTGLGVLAEAGGAPATAAAGTTDTSSSLSVTSGASSATSSTSAASSSSSSNGAIQPCPVGCPSGTPYFPPAVAIQPPDVPSSCAGGFEMNNTAVEFVAPALSPSGASGGTLDVEIATYLKPDHIRITGVDASNNEYALVDLCDLQTASSGDPTNGCSRPPDDTIRQFTVTVEPGTQSLTFDTTGACTPQYIRVLGLCEFSIGAPVPGCAFRLIP